MVGVYKYQEEEVAVEETAEEQMLVAGQDPQQELFGIPGAGLVWKYVILQVAIDLP